MLQLSRQTKFGSTYVGLLSTKKKKKFGSNYIAIVLTKQNSDQPMLQFSTQNKIRINLCCNCPDKQNSDQPMLQFFTQNKIRINLCCNFPHKTKFGSTYVAIFHTKQNSRNVPSYVRSCFSRDS